MAENSITPQDYRTIEYILGKGGVPEDDLIVALNDELLASGHLEKENGTVFASHKGTVAFNSYHEHEFSETGRESVFDSKGRFRGEHVSQECWCGKDRKVSQIIRDHRQRSPYEIL